MSWTVYMLQCADNTLYTGITNDLPRRLSQHGDGTGAKYTRGRAPQRLIYTEICLSQSDALKRERAIKTLPRLQKIVLASSWFPPL